MTKSSSLALKNSTNVRNNITKHQLVGTVLNLLWRIFPNTAIRLTNRLFFTPRQRPLSLMEKALLQHATPFELAVGKRRFKCWRWGSGRAVILVHGWSGRGIQLGDFVKPLLKAGRAVITYDAPGHGESEGRVASYFEATETLRAVIREDPDVAGIIAHSLGGAAAIGCAARESLAQPMVLIAPALKLSWLLDRIFSCYGISAVLGRAAIGDFEKVWPYTMERDDPWKLMARVVSRTLIVHDADDGKIPLSHTEELIPQHRNFSLFRTVGLGHKAILTDRSVIEKSMSHLGLDCDV